MVKQLDSTHDDSKYNPYETAGWLSRMLFLWPNQLVQGTALHKRHRIDHSNISIVLICLQTAPPRR